MPSNPWPLVSISAEATSPTVLVRRNNLVGDDFWLLLRAEWGSESSDPAEGLLVALDQFLARRRALQAACLRHGVGIEWNERAKDLVRSAEAEREALDESLAVGAPLNTKAIDLLKGSRFRRTLLPFQERDLRKLLALQHGANFSVPGAGKTAVMYATYEAERTVGRVHRLLVISPLAAFEPWIDEARLCFSTSPVIARLGLDPVHEDTEVVLVNYQRVDSAYAELATWLSQRPTHLVLDEAHRIKRGWGGQWGARCLSLAYLATRRDVMTGTPAPNSVSDLSAIVDFVWPGQAHTLLPQRAVANETPEVASRAAAVALAPLFVRTTKRELGLRAPNFEAVQVPMGPLHRQIYSALLGQYAGAFSLSRRERADFVTVGQVLMYLLEAATNPALLTAGSSRHDPIEFRHPPLAIEESSSLRNLLADYGQHETPRKFVELARRVRENTSAGRKTLVWSNFVRNLETLRRLLATYKPAVIHGGIPYVGPLDGTAPTRESEFRRFRNDPDCRVMLANPAAAGESLSLHDVCHDAVYVDRTFNAGQYLQSVDRIHRLGLPPDQPTNVVLLLSVGTVDEVVDRRVREKVATLGEVLNDPGLPAMALPDEEGYGPAIDAETDVAELFEHLATARDT